jgi:Zn-dependent M28 family amino/carboxypeptidase
MKRSLDSASRARALAAAALLLSGAASAQAPGGSEAPADTADQAAITRLQAHADFLADDLLGGRFTGTPGYDVAALYVATQLRSFGLRPVSADGGYLLPVALLAAEPDVKSARVVLTIRGERRALAWGKDFVMRPPLHAEQSEVQAPVVFVGHGVSAPEVGWDDYAGLDVRGKVVLVMSGGPAPLSADQRAHYGSGDTKAATAAARGAVGMLNFRRTTDAKRRPWERMSLNAERPSMTWIAADGSPASVFPSLRGQATIEDGLARELFAAIGRDFATVEQEANQRAGTGFALPVEVHITARARHHRLSSPNVGALLPGSDPARAGEVVVITGHLDHLGEGTEVEGDRIYNGYYDNAMGISLLLEAARALAAGPPPARSVLFLAVTAEERGLLGSEQFAAEPPPGIGTLVANVNLDMPLFLHPAADVVAFGAEHSTLEEPARRAAAAAGFVLAPDPMPDEVIFVRSDQYSFVRAGIPAVYLVPGQTSRDPNRPGGERSQLFLREHYHMPSDDEDLPVDWPTVERFLRANVELARTIADAAERPRWNPGDFFGETFGAVSSR